MNMDSNSLLQELLVKIEEITKCSVCLGDVGITVVQCTKGHGVCTSCRRKITKCPLCKEFFLGHKPTMLVQILEELPKHCKFSKRGCKEIVVSGNNHELCCEYRAIKCKFGQFRDCKWFGVAKNLKSHVQEEHNNFFTSYSCGSSKKLYFKNFKDNSIRTQYYLHVVENNIFLLFAHKDLVNKRFYQLVQQIPLGQLSQVYYFSVTFGNDIFKHSIKACAVDEKEQPINSPHCMIVSLDELESFINQSTGNLEVTYEAKVKNN